MVITPSEAILNDLLASAKRLGHNGKSEAGLMNKYSLTLLFCLSLFFGFISSFFLSYLLLFSFKKKMKYRYFMHYCVNEGKLPGTLPALRSQSKPFHPPTFDENKLEEMRDLWCVTLPKAYNWRWGQWIHQLIGNETKLEPYNKNIQIVHFNGAFKPWQWRLYPFHGWFGYWHAFTGDLSPGIFREDNLQQIPTLLFPLLVFGFIYFLSQQEWGLPRFSHWFAANFLSRVPFFGTPSSFRYTPASRWQRRSVWEQVKRGIRWIPIVGPLLFFIFGNRNRGSGRRHYSPNNSLFSSLLCIAFASYCLLYPHYYLWAEDKELIPPYLSPFFGWFLHLEWSLFLFWVPFSLYCYYFYLVGILLPSSPASDFVSTRHKEKEEDITMEDDPFLSSSSSSSTSVPEQVDEETGPTRASATTPILSTPTTFMQHPLRQFKAKEAFEKYFWLEQSGLLANCACNSLAILFLNVATLWIELYFFGFTNAVSRSMLLYVAGFFHVIYVMLWVESVPLLFFLQGKKDRRPELLSFFAKKHRS
ncbi:Alpha-N-acetylglucosamine transferase, variant 3 [Balamuthia mandrillaris]